MAWPPKNSDAIISVSGICKSILRSRLHFKLTTTDEGVGGLDLKERSTIQQMECDIKMLSKTIVV